MKVLTKKLLVAFSCFFLALTAILLTSCGEEDINNATNGSINSTELANTIEQTATNYLTGRKDVETFADSTYTFTTKGSSSYKIRYTYKENATDEQTKDGLFQNKSTYDDSIVIATKQVGEGENVDVAIVITVTNNDFTKTFEQDPDTLVVTPTESTTIRNITYTFTPITVEGSTSYYAFMQGTETIKAPEVEDEVTTYNLVTSAATKTQYYSMVTDVLYALNDDMIQYFFDSFSVEALLTSMMKVTKEGNNIAMAYAYDLINVIKSSDSYPPDYRYLISKMNISASVKFSNNNIDSANIKYSDSNDMNSNESDSTIKFTNGSNPTLLTEIPSNAIVDNDFLGEVHDIINSLENFGSLN